ncbi:hypothetical protein F5Y15DRAFT_231001 [Xylariaceae sp. FL0016]|nr:hypothetical protein F5Y15DRAFT_231001 [Xylariaceae sp. FL0016]
MDWLDQVDHPYYPMGGRGKELVRFDIPGGSSSHPRSRLIPSPDHDHVPILSPHLLGPGYVSDDFAGQRNDYRPEFYGGKLHSRQESRHDRRRGKERIDGIFTPGGGDMTLHLVLDVQDDIEELLEEFSRLTRLGTFVDAKKFFADNLEDHLDDPYVLVQFAHMQLQQGDYRAITELKDDAIYDMISGHPEHEEIRLLLLNWELMQLTAATHMLTHTPDSSSLLDEAVDAVSRMSQIKERDIGSTELQILALTTNLIHSPSSEIRWAKQRRDFATCTSPQFYKGLYSQLLRQGRIWDLHDILTLAPLADSLRSIMGDIFGCELTRGLRTLLSDWHCYTNKTDLSTTLALLSIMTHVMLRPGGLSNPSITEVSQACLPLGQSIMDTDPTSMRTRPYLRLLLVQSQESRSSSRYEADKLLRNLHSSPGVTYQSEESMLPLYIPSGNENPGWTILDAPLETRKHVELILESARHIQDYSTEFLALERRIMTTANPQKEFERLLALQSSKQGHVSGYARSLVSSYLISNGDGSKATLKREILQVLAQSSTTGRWDKNEQWLINMLLLKLEGRSSTAIQRILDDTGSRYLYMDIKLLQDICSKLPEIDSWAQRQVQRRKTPRHQRLARRTAYSDARSETRKEQTSAHENSKTSDKRMHPKVRNGTEAVDQRKGSHGVQTGPPLGEVQLPRSQNSIPPLDSRSRLENAGTLGAPINTIEEQESIRQLEARIHEEFQQTLDEKLREERDKTQSMAQKYMIDLAKRDAELQAEHDEENHKIVRKQQELAEKVVTETLQSQQEHIKKMDMEIRSWVGEALAAVEESARQMKAEAMVEEAERRRKIVRLLFLVTPFPQKTAESDTVTDSSPNCTSPNIYIISLERPLLGRQLN